MVNIFPFKNAIVTAMAVTESFQQSFLLWRGKAIRWGFTSRVATGWLIGALKLTQVATRDN
ncbi:MAG: hypothetical protein R2788_23505 [Saprospiraceae bacterium]